MRRANSSNELEESVPYIETRLCHQESKGWDVSSQACILHCTLLHLAEPESMQKIPRIVGRRHGMPGLTGDRLDFVPSHSQQQPGRQCQSQQLSCVAGSTDYSLLLRI